MLGSPLCLLWWLASYKREPHAVLRANPEAERCRQGQNCPIWPYLASQQPPLTRRGTSSSDEVGGAAFVSVVRTVRDAMRPRIASNRVKDREKHNTRFEKSASNVEMKFAELTLHDTWCSTSPLPVASHVRAFVLSRFSLPEVLVVFSSTCLERERTCVAMSAA